MRQAFNSEWRSFLAAIQSLDLQTLVVLILTPLLVLVQFKLGSRGFFREHLSVYVPDATRGILSWGWWFSVQGVTGFIIPVLVLLLLFKRTPTEIGLGLGDWKLGLSLTAVYLVGVVAGTWFLSANAHFQAVYPHYQPAARNWNTFLIYELLFVFYWLGWEYLWRGFMLFGTRHTLGLWAILIQAIPFALLHISKPTPEALLSIPGGILLGALVWRCNSFWIAVPLHAAQMIILDFWCTLRIRTGVPGTGPAALFKMISAWLSGHPS